METQIKSPLFKGVLVVAVDDLRSVLVGTLEQNGYCCQGVSDVPGAHTVLSVGGIDLVICDISIPGMDGFRFMGSAKEDVPDIDFIIITGDSGPYPCFEVLEAGAADCITKPFKVDSVIARIRRIERERKILFDLKTTNHELVAAMEEIEEVSLARGDFLARMSHEIRIPLNSIKGYTDILLDTGLSCEQEEYVVNTKKSCDVLLGVVNEILDISRIEAGEIGLDPIEFDPEVLCFECLEMVRSQVNTSRVELLCRICDCVPGYVVADPNRFRQVLLNLLGNAAKFTEAGVIELNLSVRQRSGDGIMLCACLRDTGMGIPESALDAIFEPFRQVQGGSSAKHGGTGLGLSICRKIARRMGGEIKVESREGEGSLFEFSFWALPVENKASERIQPAQFEGHRILVVTSTLAFGAMVSRELKAAGLYVDLVLNLKAAITSFDRSFLPSVCYDACVVDLKGGVDPKELIRKIRRTKSACPSFPMIACAGPIPGGAETCRKLGFEGFLPKPVRAKKLVSMIAGILGMKADRDKGFYGGKNKLVTTPFLAEQAKRYASILLVDDNPVNRRMGKILLSKAGYRVTTADNGRQTLDLYQGCPDRFDLILMDINMPEMDGFEITRQIRIQEAVSGTRIPIVAFTANVLPVFKQRCLEAGMDDLLTKPFKREDIFSVVKKWVL